MLIYTAEITVHNGTGTETLYLSSHGFVTKSADTPTNIAFEARLVDPVMVKLSAYDNITGGGSSTGGGEIVIANADNFYGYLANYGFDGRQVIVRVGENTAAYPSGFTTVLNGTMIAPKFDKTRFTIRVKDKQEVLNKPLLTTTYAGNNSLPSGLEGVTGDIKGRVKPRTYGKVYNVEPVFVNTSRLIYQVSDGAINSVDAVYDRGVALTKGADYSSQADMETNAPAASSFRVWPVGGYFRLGSSAVGQVTADVVQGAASSNRTVAQLLGTIATTMGTTVNSSDVTALDALNNAEVGIYITSDTTALSIMDELAQSIGAWFSFNHSGELRMGRLDVPSGTPALYVDSNTFTKLDLVSNADTENGVPVYKWVLDYKKFYVVQDSDLAGDVTTARRSELVNEFRTVTAIDATVQTKYLLASEGNSTTLLVDPIAAQTECTRLLGLHKTRRDRVGVRVRLDAETISAINIMSVARVTANAFDYSSGRDFRVLGYTLDTKNMVADLVLWG